MAKLIEPTPELRGKDADRFLKQLIKTNKRKITKKEIEVCKELERFEW